MAKKALPALRERIPWHAESIEHGSRRTTGLEMDRQEDDN